MRKLIILISLLMLTACGQKQPDIQQEIRIGIVGTLAAMPSATPQPTTAFPTPVPTFTIKGLFCEYSFCIGHPEDIALFDAAQNPAARSAYGGGKVAGFRDNLFILTTWVQSSGDWNPASMNKIVMDEFAVTATGEMTTSLIGNWNVASVPVTPPANSVFVNGLAATWRCGERDFVWLGFSASEGGSVLMLQEALGKFRCE